MKLTGGKNISHIILVIKIDSQGSHISHETINKSRKTCKLLHKVMKGITHITKLLKFRDAAMKLSETAYKITIIKLSIS